MSQKRRRSQCEIRGVCYFYSETGTEGGFWAFQDARYIKKGRYDYKGLHLLKNGDRLTVYSKTNPKKAIWSGTIKLKKHPGFTKAVFGLWIHADQEGVNRKKWATWFFEKHPASLIVGR
jgi:hypothetical protein